MLTAGSLQTAIDGAVKHQGLTVSATTSRAGRTVGREVLASTPGGRASDSYYDSSQLISRAGTDNNGKLIYVDYAARIWYTPAGGGIPAVNPSWIVAGLQGGTLRIAGRRTVDRTAVVRIEGSDQLGSRVVIDIDPNTNLPKLVTTFEPAGVTVQHYTWSGTAVTRQDAASAAATVIAPKSFRHLAHAPNPAQRPSGNG